MAKHKTTKAIYRTVRINPLTSKEDADMFEIVTRLEAEGFTFKQIAQDAILRAEGQKPEMYSRVSSGYILGGVEEMLTRFAEELLSKIGTTQRVVKPDADSDDDGEVTPFATKFAKSFIERNGGRR